MISDGIREVQPEPTGGTELERLRERVAILEALTASPLWSHRALCEKLSGTINSHFGARFVDPPDGGNVPLHVQVERMACALNEAEAALKPFAKAAQDCDVADDLRAGVVKPADVIWESAVAVSITFAHVARAAEALENSKAGLADATNKAPSP